MATGTNEHKDLYYLKMRAKKDKQTEPHFQMARAIKGGSAPMEDVTFVTGRISDIRNSSYEWDGDIIETVKITMIDGDETYVIDSSYTSLLRGLLNCLANIEAPGDIKISLYVSKTGYANVWVENNGESSGYKWPWDDLKKYIQVFTDDKGKERNSYLEMDKFYATQVEELIGPRYRDSYVPVASDNFKELEAVTDTKEETVPVMGDDTESDDLPF